MPTATSTPVTLTAVMIVAVRSNRHKFTRLKRTTLSSEMSGKLTGQQAVRRDDHRSCIVSQSGFKDHEASSPITSIVTAVIVTAVVEAPVIVAPIVFCWA